MTVVGLDFSINKPAACIRKEDGTYDFIGWPYDPDRKLEKLYAGCPVLIVHREDDKVKGNTISEKMRYEVKNAKYLSNLMFNTLQFWVNLNKDTYIGFEGLSYASSGDVVLQLGGYKYMLMAALSEIVPLENMFTYSPITVKSIAGCAKKGMGKPDMIKAFMDSDIQSGFRTALRDNTDKFMKKGGKNYIDHVDDLVDAFWVLQTTMIKEKLS